MFELVFGGAFFQGNDEAFCGEKYVTDDLVDFDELGNEKVLFLKCKERLFFQHLLVQMRTPSTSEWYRKFS